MMGEVVTKRKEWSDKGVLKGPKKKRGAQEVDDDSDEEEAGPSKRKKVATVTKSLSKGKGKALATKKAAAAKARAQLPPSDEFLTDTDLEDFE
jgi:hypothetical protein